MCWDFKPVSVGTPALPSSTSILFAAWKPRCLAIATQMRTCEYKAGPSPHRIATNAMSRSRLLFANGYLLLIAWMGPAQSWSQSESEPSNLVSQEFEKLDWAHLPNVHRINHKVASGGQPEGAAAFAELQRQGVRTILSVDGARPDVDRARQFGLRYVHLPHGYDGISAERTIELALALRDLEGPIYIHCHHGKHRSPAAAAAACRTLGWIGESEAIRFLEQAGTSPSYRGLYETVRRAQPVRDEELNATKVDFCETAPLPPLAEAMVEIEHIFNRLQSHFSASPGGLTTPGEDVAHDALLLREQYTELIRLEAPVHSSALQRQLMNEALELARALELSLETVPRELGGNPSGESAGLLSRLRQNCNDCHRRIRDVPLSEKPSR